MPESTIDPAGNEIQAYWDVRGRRSLLDDPDMSSWEYFYNGFGELVEAHDSDGGVTTYDHDRAGRVTNVTSYEEHTIFEYDTAAHGIGRLARTVNADGTVETAHEYDDLGRQSKTTWTIDGLESFSVGLGYDDLGRQSRVEYPHTDGLNFAIEREYDDVGDVERVVAEYFNPVFNTQEFDLLWEVTGRRADGALLSARMGNGVKTVRSYDPMGRVDLLSWEGLDTSIDLDYDYTASR